MADITNLEKGTKLYKFIKQALPDYRKKKVFITRSYPHAYEQSPPIGGWSGGSLTYALRIVMGINDVMAVMPVAQKSQFGSQEPEKVILTDDQAMITSGTFNGKPETAVIYCTETFCSKHLSPFGNLP